MARHDVYAVGDDGYWLDCQSDFLAGLKSRFVVPLRAREEVKGEDKRLNPTLTVAGAEYVMQTHLAAAVPASLLRIRVTSLAEDEYRIGAALDMLTGTY